MLKKVLHVYKIFYIITTFVLYCDSKHSDIWRGLVMFIVTSFHLSFLMSQLVLSKMKLTKCTPSILMYYCDHIICPGLSILFLYAPAHKAWIFEKFFFELEAFSWDFKIDCILLWQLMSLNKKMVVPSRKFHILISWSPICTFVILVSASMKIANTL